MFTAHDITPEIILNAYHTGIFPMAESVDSPTINFYKPDMRGQLSIDNIHIPKRLIRTVKNAPYEIKINEDFIGVIDGCASAQKGRETSWINPIIRDVFIELHKMGHAHSVECWAYDESNNLELVGGLYGLVLGQIFCGESMFSFKKDASKIALVHLCARLHMGGFHVLDTQFINDHLKQFGAYEITSDEYDMLIKSKAHKDADFILPSHSPQYVLDNYLESRSINDALI